MYEKYIKRFFDIVLCSLGFIVLSPIFLVSAAAIKLSSPGPVFYYSDRVGKNRKPFHFYKFRSMHVTNEDKHLCVGDADRIFPYGKIMRRLKIDELPQLLNVILGDMSIVGPRPMMTHSVDKFYSGKYAEVLTIKPGLTSAASLYDYIVGDTYQDDAAYRREVVPIKQEMELMYVRRQSFLYDCELVIRTITTIIQVFFGKKNYKECPEYREAAENLRRDEAARK